MMPGTPALLIIPASLKPDTSLLMVALGIETVSTGLFTRPASETGSNPPTYYAANYAAMDIAKRNLLELVIAGNLPTITWEDFDLTYERALAAGTAIFMYELTPWSGGFPAHSPALTLISSGF